MMRHIKPSSTLLLLALFPFAGCSKDDSVATPAKDPKPNCTYVLPENSPVITPAENPELLAAPFEQEKLIQLMSLGAEQDTCFIRYQGQVDVFKITDTFAALSVGEQNIEDPLFAALAPAPEDLIPPWKAMEDEFHLPLMGVTFIRFFDQPARRELVDARIVMNPKARPWHMWHEFGHFLIAQTRYNNPEQKLTAPAPEDVDAAKQVLINSLENNNSDVDGKSDSKSEQLAAFASLVDVYRRYDERVHLEELAIELALLHYAGEAENILVAPQDPDESFRTVDFFFQTHVNWYKNFFREMRPLLRGHKELQVPLADMETNLKENDHKMRELIRSTRARF